ncbi:hypothetical protein [Amycolatopsis australiensis]|uniref:Uncharacterized protein n=1 Tax=Amycolatopsis australiensis TaxID=546364 RepID=A0A1K1RK16_9PSEU|nr:hypothetical protein [Amycolatopsis australiensis]SFW72519.1 hypothetical protein SAMN04489730_3460 [Amycolatopsis australiensis]
MDTFGRPVTSGIRAGGRARPGGRGPDGSAAPARHRSPGFPERFRTADPATGFEVTGSLVADATSTTESEEA